LSVKVEEEMTSLKNRVALVTGSARGIGKAIAVRYGSLGASVVVNYSTDEKRAQETVGKIERTGSVAIAVQADISKVADIDRLFAAALEKFGRLDIVVANAGVELVGQPFSISPKRILTVCSGSTLRALSSRFRKPPSMSPTTAALSTSDQAPRLFHCQGTHYMAAAKSRPNS
jgi:NAD(P)-dependent dehydrogenase (short-subunit alcohol dehydrogenase family)